MLKACSPEAFAQKPSFFQAEKVMGGALAVWGGCDRDEYGTSYIRAERTKIREKTSDRRNMVQAEVHVAIEFVHLHSRDRNTTNSQKPMSKTRKK